jgi:hypothetical protein
MAKNQTKKAIYSYPEFVTIALSFNFTSRRDYFLRASKCDSMLPYHPEMHYTAFKWGDILKGEKDAKFTYKSCFRAFV